MAAHEQKAFKTLLLQNKEKNIPTISVLTCARDGTLKIPWISSGGLLTPNHKNMFRPLAKRKIPSSERRVSEQRIAAGNVVLLTSKVCCEAEVRVRRPSCSLLPLLPFQWCLILLHFAAFIRQALVYFGCATTCPVHKFQASTCWCCYQDK